MKRIIFSATMCLLGAAEAFSFCGFYVAKTNAKLFNKSSQVIMARNGNSTVITMENDYEGPLEDFAMVVPVPVVLKKNQIRTVERSIFTKLDEYSAPRMTKYYDNDPCPVPVTGTVDCLGAGLSSTYHWSSAATNGVYYVTDSVKIEARYEVDEYDILILSANESEGLKNWLLRNGYKIPAKAEEVLTPYIKSNMKFFVVKVNLKRAKNKEINPIQISFESEKFMLPIRLGMANSKGSQDMMVYFLTKNGRVETTNYRTVKIPTDNEIPVFVKDKFDNFYKDAFSMECKRKQNKTVFLEYAWDVSTQQPVKCDPCVGPPPIYADLTKAGVDWVQLGTEKVFFTRLHVRYDRENFPQDLMFQETSNTEHFQGRYVIRYPASSSFKCEEAKAYLSKLVLRREKELHELANLTGWDISKYPEYVGEFRKKLLLHYAGKTEDITPYQHNDWSWGNGWGQLQPVQPLQWQPVNWQPVQIKVSTPSILKIEPEKQTDPSVISSMDSVDKLFRLINGPERQIEITTATSAPKSPGVQKKATSSHYFYWFLGSLVFAFVALPTIRSRMKSKNT